MHDMTKREARCALTRYEVVPVKGETSGKLFPCFAFSDRGAGGGKLRVRYARGVWRMNGLHNRIRHVVLSNFHVQSIFIRVTVYLILILKGLISFLQLADYFNSKLHL